MSTTYTNGEEFERHAMFERIRASAAQSAALQARLKLVEERARQAEELLRETLDVSYGASISLEVRGAIRAFLAASEPRQGEGNE